MANLDLTITKFLYQLLVHNPFLDHLFLFFSALGNYALIWLIIGFVLAVIEKKTQPKLVLMFVLGLSLTILITTGLKAHFQRARPFFLSLKYEQAKLISPQDYSFPSGHTASSFFSAAFLTSYLFNKKIKKTKKNGGALANPLLYRYLLPTLLYLVAILIAYSRIYLSVHYASDLLGGGIIGFLIAKLIYKYGVCQKTKKG